MSRTFLKDLETFPECIFFDHLSLFPLLLAFSFTVLITLLITPAHLLTTPRDSLVRTPSSRRSSEAGVQLRDSLLLGEKELAVLVFVHEQGERQGQFRDFQIHFVEQYFGSPGRATPSVGHTKLSSLLQKLAPEFCREERRPQVFVWRKSNHACKTTSSRAPARQINAKMGAGRSASECVPEHLACEGAEEFLAAASQVSVYR